MMCTMKRCVALLGLCVLAGVATASAQVTYQITSVPTFVISTGDSEVLGSVRLTATAAVPTIQSTIQFLFPGIACDNDNTTGMTVSNSTGIYAPTGSDPALFASSAVVNTSGGCTVNVTVAAGSTPAVGDRIQLDGVRGRVVVAGFPVGGNITCALFSTPSNSSLFTAPSSVVVGTPEVGLVVTVSTGTELLCLESEFAGNITLTEGYNGAFAQTVKTLALGSNLPASPRPPFGATNNSEFKIVIGPVPSGVTLSFPNTVHGSLGAYTAGSAGDELQLLPQGSGVISGPTTTTTTLVYEYACGNQSVCDTSLESFVVSPGVTVSPTSAIGSVTADAELWPPEVVPPPSITTQPSVTDPLNRPRFIDPLKPGAPNDVLLLVAPCTTNLLFPWVVSNVAQFDTGIAIANTSVDPFSAIVANPTPPEHGTCTITGFPKGEGTPVALTTGDISAGDTYTAVLSTTAFNGFSGYIIARCNFQYGHGFAFISNNFGTGMPPTVGQGYIALIIPDPAVQDDEVPSRGAAPATWSSVGDNTNTGEELSQ